MLPAKQVLKYMAIVPYKVPFVMAGAKRRLQQRIDEIQMLPGFADLLQSLSTRYQLGVVTSNAQKNVSRFLRDHDAAVIDFIYADTRLSGKARVLKKVLKKECLQPTRTLYIGDEIRDIKAAKVAGIAVIAVTWGYNTREVLVQHHPDHVVDTLEQLDTAIQAVFI
jgi:phosphoglycolate phosphatase